MPVFNEERYISEAIGSVLSQTYEDWELIVVNDGSSDNTEQVVKQFKDRRITLLNKPNSDQLDSILFASPNVSGELVYLLHGDDRVSDNDVFEKNVNVFKNGCVDYINYPYSIMDGDGCVSSQIKPKILFNNLFLKANLLLNFGRNLKADHFFCTRKFFGSSVMRNYIKRNKPFWMNLNDLNNGGSVTITHSVFDYRCHEGNYLASKVGLYNVINGNIRSTLDLLEVVSVPFFNIQRYLFKIYNKLNVIGLPVFFRNKPSSAKACVNVIEKLLNIYQVSFEDYRLLKLVKKYRLNSYSGRLDLSGENIQECFGPAQVRILNKAILDNNINSLPKSFAKLLCCLESREIGFVISSKENDMIIKDYLDLLNVRLKVIIADE